MTKALTASQIFDEAAKQVTEIMPWDLEELLESDTRPFILDVREPLEFDMLKIKDSMNVPRGILENACDYNYAETEPELIKHKNRPILIVCRSGNRSAAAALTMQLMGYTDVASLKLGVKGWNDFDGPLQDMDGNTVDPEKADELLNPAVKPDQLNPKR